MQREKKPRPQIGNRPEKKIETTEQKLQKIQIFYKYRLPSIYRQLKIPIYEPSSQTIKPKINKTANLANQPKSFERSVEVLYKKLMLNSKYHHRQKMRFSRTPLLKHIKYDFKLLEEKLKNKKYMKIYEDLEEDDEEDDSKEKKQYEVNPQFSADSISKYKRKHNIGGKIVIALGYQDLKRRLIDAHGWTQNADTTSLIYDFKYMSKKKDIDYVNLLDEQVVNHYNENKAITAKFGLTRNIRNISSIKKDPSLFFPRCFDVNDVSELQNFFENFKVTFAESILKLYFLLQGNLPEGPDMQKIEMGVRKCLRIMENQIMPIDKKIQKISQKDELLISYEQWQSLREIYKGMKKMSKNQEESTGKINENLLKNVKNICEVAAKSDPQWYLNRENIWIVKPASMSRGRGIKTFDNIYEILDYIIGKEISWVAQKYIENPLIIKKRKFDIRQWVLLTDFKPFRVWVYEECYIRFCAQIYTPEDLKNRKIHLTNNSVTKGETLLKDGIQENMMNEKQFSDLLATIEGKEIFKTILRPQINKISVQALESVKENIVSRQNTLELFGFDFMVDENYKVWLIEVNSSPTMEHSTKVTADIVERGMSDLGDLVNNYMFRGKNYNKKKSEQLYGGWKLLTNP